MKNKNKDADQEQPSTSKSERNESQTTVTEETKSSTSKECEPSKSEEPSTPKECEPSKSEEPSTSKECEPSKSEEPSTSKIDENDHTNSDEYVEITFTDTDSNFSKIGSDYSKSSESKSDDSKNSKRKYKDDKNDETTAENPKSKRFRKKKKVKVQREHVDFIKELGYKNYIQMLITDIFSSLDDKDLTAAFCVSKKWNRVLSQNDTLRRRRQQYIHNGLIHRLKWGIENWPINKKEIKPKNRRVLGELTNLKNQKLI